MYEKSEIIKESLNNLKLYNHKEREIIMETKTFDICQIIKECTIDEISKYLIKEGNKRNFPDITTRQ